ncbi:Translation initiation factor IF2/IF5 zinc-binding [Penicillium coprophilum]|uniref:Translation initiation factor IF2/IF5 zinc-binding n=1 Tax=Penicillium coprophilum TaxID=36646 RepID=UPI00239956C8|nr:Translation initiation factor IF2/IF5 zinc-binding [Penicillium coprophilum]KAJ5154526.1 Translation initiation factor IF2/IF5 zinc-binding [Penicillium coprophilum]
MADAEIETKQRKSVAFSEGSVIMDTNGQVTDAPPAEKPTGEKDVDEVTEMFKGLSKKKKSSKKSKSAEAGDDDEAPAADGEFDPSALKKKKSSKKTKKVDPNDFDAKLAEAGLAEEAGEDQPEELPEGDLEAGTGIWAHDATQPIPYSLLVSRFFSLIESHHPDLLSSGAKSYKIPPAPVLA